MAEAARLGRRRRRKADDVEPILSFVIARRLKGREHRDLRGEFESDRHLRRALAQRAIDKMQEEGVDLEGESDTPVLDWIRDNWKFILQALMELIGMFSGVPGMTPASSPAAAPKPAKATTPKKR